VLTDRRRRLAGPDRRFQVLRAAASQFAKTGLRGTTTRTLARAAGVSEQILYVHFGSKECLFREAVKDNIKVRLQLLESRTVSAVYEGEKAAIQRIAEVTVTGCVGGAGKFHLDELGSLRRSRICGRPLSQRAGRGRDRMGPGIRGTPPGFPLP
jgi:AcrR family transcriptional regulator